MERVLPVMLRMLRDDMLKVLAEAFELQALSLELDMNMTAAMLKFGWNELNTTRYGGIYRACGRSDGRERQVELIHVETIWRKESDVMLRLFAGDQDPFRTTESPAN